MIPTTVRRQTGSVTLVFLFSTVAVTLSLLAAIDIMRYNLVQSRLQSALDAAVLAAGRNLGNQPGQSGTEAWKADARAYLQANMPNGYLGSNYDISKVTISVTGDNKTGQTLKMSATGELPLLVAGFLSTKELPLSAANQAVRSSRRDLELVLVLDNTGSMGNWSGSKTKVQHLQEAANVLIDTLFGEGNDPSNFHVGIVPFSSTVRPVDANNNIPLHWAKNSSKWPFTKTFNLDTLPKEKDRKNANEVGFRWTGCFAEQSGNSIPLESPPAPGLPGNKKLVPYFYMNPNTDAYRRKLAAPTSFLCNLSPTTFLTNQKTVLKQAIANLHVDGATMIPAGALWGWRMLSPEWRGSNGWGSDTLPQDKLPYLTKAMIIMTDGANGGFGDQYAARSHTYVTPEIKESFKLTSTGDGLVTQSQDDFDLAANSLAGLSLQPYGVMYGNYGWGNYFDDDKASATLNSLLLSNCTAIKNDKIKIWTITFGSSANTPSIKNTMKSCASEAYYHAPTGDQLKEIFKDIAGQLSELRLVQ
ncbi:pilus assembly protein TadG-related protein [Laribacter hongkongensis]|uniref:Pilus assembly protein TadG-related protein n=1 Tax=Laribacter hongkongensis TaxID=168471 RepID=A0ABD4SLY0_9NEIS|nr:pilus assembly protein TadG-related protein [Laribacter hongkongensis]MCG9024725.1 pilus assembly protein TadG-related protein [Laribacter hongkongensis]MCG9096572.1 pilus assembly protein TadG-related protein [Laribacter hongkongensis]MCG9100762.1 pilus assembly protein TadG-related protein [Laribacter hongkongensis]MCG9102136.1 pilus assembly protein TadG-related protein [Laribacter hongkongensis]MCG9112170.1 pilus assembly protein TadG-related protein [Laribacter hongkongensis]